MKLQIETDKIIIENCEEFNIEETLECGQVFSYVKTSPNSYMVISQNKVANIIYDSNQIVIQTKDVKYFYNFFDLDTNYSNIKQQILTINPEIKKYMGYGAGIRILKQDVYQTIISFIVSANNNIKRIKNILFKLSQSYGTCLEENVYSFPTLNQLKLVTSEQYYALGAGYRSEYLPKTVKALLSPEFSLEKLIKLPTPELREKLLTLSGVGPKVADCILLFGFSRTDVFPIDTWMRKCYYLFETEKLTDKQIAKYFVNKYGLVSGYAQQYLFNYMINHNQK